MAKSLRITLVVAIAWLALACESTRPYYDPDRRDWQRWSLPGAGELDYVVFLVGDAGEPAVDPPEPNFRLLRRELSAAGERSAIVFLGDNIYPAGLPPEGDPGREEARRRLDAQLELLKDFAGRPFFIPGNHDWNRMAAGGRDAVRRQEAYIEAYLNNDKVFYPKGGCGEPQAVELDDNLTLILIDSQWWLQRPEDKEPDDSCRSLTKADFRRRLAELVAEYDKGNILLCLHHPVYTQGSHNGYFPIKEHIFPLTYLSDGLFIPLPLLGSLHPTLRYLGITRQDQSHPEYQALIEAVKDAIDDQDNVVVAAGHEHAMQYYFEDDHHFIVSGAGCKGSYFKRGYDAEFGYEREGFAKVYYYRDGQVWLEFWAPDGDGSAGKLLYRRRLKEADMQAPDNPETTFAESWQGMPDTVGYLAAPNYEASASKRFWLGRNYRDAWTAEVRLPVLDLDTTLGGLRPIKRGGGLQSKSLRLEAADGRQYVLRSIYKDASLILPDFARNTVIDTIFQDQMSMDHPYGAIIIPPLAKAAGVYHAHPRFYYLPRQPRLGDFNRVFGEEAYLFEERPDDNWEDQPSFGNSPKIVSYRNMLRKTRENQDHVIDQEQTLRSRLFDIYIGDWDRHDDQWRWATFKQDGRTIYQPIPRDRDHAFLSFRGVFPWLASRRWAARQLHSFNKDIHDIAGLNFNARFFDRHYLNEQDLGDWLRVAEDMKTQLTDSVIAEAIRRWPDTIRALNGPEIRAKLLARRDKLPEFARNYYRFLARTVDVPGTDERERFEVVRLDEGKTRVTVYNLNKKGEKKDIRYERTFDRRHTREVRLYGLKGDDEFIVEGASGRNVLLRIVGGPGNDLVRDDSRVSGGRRTRVYDLKTEANQLEMGAEARDRTSRDPERNEYDREAFRYPKTLPLVLPGYNPDDGLILNLGFLRTVHGFRKDPFQSRHKVQAQYAFATRAVGGQYTGDFVDAVGAWDLELRARALAPTFVSNFFGLGNNTPYLDTEDEQRDFNRLRYGQISINPALKRRMGMNTQQFKIGIHYTLTDVQRTAGRISDPVFDARSGLSDADYDPKQYAGLQVSYHIDHTDNRFNPTRGMRLNAGAGWNINLEDAGRQYLQLSSDLSVYYTPFSPLPLTLAVRGGYAANVGDYEFFQANFLGRRTNLRGFRGERFGGDRALYANAEARMRLFKLRGLVLPTNVGVLGFYDVGRVWHDGDGPGDDAWHPGWGGGLYLSPYEQIVLSAAYTQSRETRFLEVQFGFFF